MSEKRDAYVEKFKAKIDEMNAEIDRLSAKARQSEADARIKYQDQIEELERHRDEARTRLQKFQEASGGAWEDLKAGTEMAFESMSMALKSIRERFKF